MGKAVLIAILAFSIGGVINTFNTRRTLNETENREALHQHQVLARNVALVGYHLARQRLSESQTSTTFTGAFESGTYDVTVEVAGTRATVTSTGTVLDARDNAVTALVQASFKTDDSLIPEDPPAFMQYALISDLNLNLNGNILGEILVTGDERATLNANMHTNGNLHIDGNSVFVAGFGTYVGSGSANPAKALQNSFQPNYNPTGESGAHQTLAVDIPDFDAAAYTSRLTIDTLTTGLTELAGSYAPGGTREHPYIWYVQGDLTATGNTTMDGYVMFIVEGDAVFNGNMQAGNSGYNGPDESSIALYVGGSVELGGNTEVYGQIFAGGDVVFMHGTPRVYGSITTKGAADLRGNPKIYYRKASPALTTIWEDLDEIRWTLETYSEW